METPIVPAGPRDGALVHSLVGEFYAEAGYPFDAERAARAVDLLLGAPDFGRILLARRAEVAGYVAVTFGFSLEFHGRDAFVDELFVRPACRKEGVGRRLLEAAEEECRRAGVGALHLEVERDNPAGRALYARRGFRDDGRLLLSKRLG